MLVYVSQVLESILKISILRRACKIPSLKFKQQILSHCFCVYGVIVHNRFIILQNLHVFCQTSTTGDLLLPKIDLIFGVKLAFYFG